MRKEEKRRKKERMWKIMEDENIELTPDMEQELSNNEGGEE